MTTRERFDVIIDVKNTLKFLCECDDTSSNRDNTNVSESCNYNQLLIYDTFYFLHVAKQMDFEPAVIVDDYCSDEYCGTVFFYYRGVKFFTYIYKDEKEEFEELAHELFPEWRILW